MTPVISVIVPIYKVEKYLDRCVESIVNQTFSVIEIILVDDGSPDNCGKMCDEWAKKDSRIKAFHKENGGLSDARNFGIEHSTAEFLIFIDSDDFIEPQMLEVLYGLITEHGADVAVCGLYNCYKSGRFARCTDDNIIVCDGKKALEYVLIGDRMSVEAPTKLIKREVLGDLRFLKGKTSEDAFFTPELLTRVNKLVETPKPLYNYWHRGGSITTAPFNEKGTHVIEAYEINLEKIKNTYPDLITVAECRLFWAHFTVLDRILASSSGDDLPAFKTSVAFLKKNWLKVVKNPYFTKSRKLSAIALKINVKLYKILSNANRRHYEEQD